MNRSERNDKILVTGATGTIGSEVVKQLASYNNNAIRAAVHSQNKADKFKQYRTVEIVN
jgi:FlaA1/EpsC-like NDP-sugar epimerase